MKLMDFKNVTNKQRDSYQLAQMVHRVVFNHLNNGIKNFSPTLGTDKCPSFSVLLSCIGNGPILHPDIFMKYLKNLLFIQS
jgi:hypothetical protein